jgi:IS1 transposase
MWSFVGNKKNPRWLWRGIDRNTGLGLAYVFRKRKGEVFLKLKELLAPFGIQKHCTDVKCQLSRPNCVNYVDRLKPREDDCCTAACLRNDSAWISRMTA